MQSTKSQKSASMRKLKVTQELQPNKTCRCGACEPRKPKLPNGMRRLKIQPKCRDYAWNRSIVPQIMLQGKWLEQIGFECHSHVIITTLQGKLVIEIDKE